MYRLKVTVGMQLWQHAWWSWVVLGCVLGESARTQTGRSTCNGRRLFFGPLDKGKPGLGQGKQGKKAGVLPVVTSDEG